jgi:hypothetical protein
MPVEARVAVLSDARGRSTATRPASHEEEVDDDAQWASWAAYLLRSRRTLRRVRAARPGSPLG